MWRAWLPLARSCAPVLDENPAPESASGTAQHEGLHRHPIVRVAQQQPGPSPPTAQLAALASSPHSPPPGPAAPDEAPSCLLHHLRFLPSAEAQAASAALSRSTPLAVAAAVAGPEGTAAVQDLLTAGADPAQPDPASGLTPLHIATMANEDTAAALLEVRGQQEPGARGGLRCGRCRCCTRGRGAQAGHGSSLRVRQRRWRKASATRLLARAATRSGYTVMHCAAAAGSVRMIRALASLGADVETATVEGVTPAHVAAAHGHPDSLRALASMRTMRDPPATGATWTPLGIACICGQAAAAAEAVRMGDLPLDTCGPHGARAPDLAMLASPSKRGGVLAVLGHTALSTMTARSSVLPLAVCAEGNALTTVLAQVEEARGAACWRGPMGGTEPPPLAAYRVSRSTTNRVRELCGETGRLVAAGDSLLTLAARVGTADTVRLLLREGADPSAAVAGAPPLGHALARWAVHASKALPSNTERALAYYSDAVPSGGGEPAPSEPEALVDDHALQEAKAVVQALAHAVGNKTFPGSSTDAAGTALSMLQRHHFDTVREMRRAMGRHVLLMSAAIAAPLSPSFLRSLRDLLSDVDGAGGGGETRRRRPAKERRRPLVRELARLAQLNPSLPPPVQLHTLAAPEQIDAAEDELVAFDCADGVIQAARDDLEPVLPRLAAALRSGMQEAASRRLQLAEPVAVVWALLCSSLHCGQATVDAALRAAPTTPEAPPITVQDTAARCGAAMQLADEWIVPRLERQATSLLRRLMDENPALAATTASFAAQGSLYTELASISLTALTLQFERAIRAAATEHALDLRTSRLALCDLFCKLCALESAQ